MRPKTARLLFRLWGAFVAFLMVGGALFAGWDWWQRKHPKPPSRRTEVRGLVISVKPVDGGTEVLVESPGAVWRAVRGARTRVRTRAGLTCEVEPGQVVKVWFPVTTDTALPPNHAEWILVEGYKPQVLKP